MTVRAGEKGLLLDTHILVAIVEGRLDLFGPQIRSAVTSPSAQVHASVASLWEIAIKWRAAKLALSVPPDQLAAFFEKVGIVVLPIDARHVVAPYDPVPPTRDPFDRLLLSICQAEGLRLVTIDRALAGHPLSFAPSLS